jgi:hypothetical protein
MLIPVSAHPAAISRNQGRSRAHPAAISRNQPQSGEEQSPSSRDQPQSAAIRGGAEHLQPLGDAFELMGGEELEECRLAHTVASNEPIPDDGHQSQSIALKGNQWHSGAPSRPMSAYLMTTINRNQKHSKAINGTRGRRRGRRRVRRVHTCAHGRASGRHRRATSCRRGPC